MRESLTGRIALLGAVLGATGCTISGQPTEFLYNGRIGNDSVVFDINNTSVFGDLQARMSVYRPDGTTLVFESQPPKRLQGNHGPLQLTTFKGYRGEIQELEATLFKNEPINNSIMDRGQELFSSYLGEILKRNTDAELARVARYLQ